MRAVALVGSLQQRYSLVAALQPHCNSGYQPCSCAAASSQSGYSIIAMTLRPHRSCAIASLQQCFSITNVSRCTVCTECSCCSMLPGACKQLQGCRTAGGVKPAWCCSTDQCMTVVVLCNRAAALPRAAEAFELQ